MAAAAEKNITVTIGEDYLETIEFYSDDAGTVTLDVSTRTYHAWIGLASDAAATASFTVATGSANYKKDVSMAKATTSALTAGRTKWAMWRADSGHAEPIFYGDCDIVKITDFDL